MCRYFAGSVLAVAALALSSPIDVLAQQQPTPGTILPFSTLEVHEYDSINLATLGIQLNIPVRSKAGHFPFSYSLVGSPNVYKNVQNNSGHFYVTFMSNPGIKGTLTNIGGTVQPTTVSQAKTCAGFLNITGNGGWTFTDATGDVHPIGIGGYLWPYSACGPTAAGAFTSDGSGIYVYIDNSGNNGKANFYTIDGNGNKTIPSGASGGVASYTDPNGNSIGSGSGGYTDTLGQTALTLGGTYSNSTYSWTDALGRNQSTAISTTSLTLDPTFGCSWNSTGPPAAVLFPSSISFPDGSSLGFGWETNYANSTHYTGRLASLTLPTGGTISYSYSGGTNGIDCATGNNATVTRTTPDGTWTYVSTDGQINTATTVTDPEGNSIVYNFTYAHIPLLYFAQGAPLVTEKQVYTKGSLTQTVITCYNNPSSTPSNCSSTFQIPVTEKDEYTTYPGVTGYAAVKTTYDTYGNVTDIKKFDFNATTPTNEEQMVYGTGSPSSQTCSAISSNIVKKVCSDTLLDSQHGNAVLKQTWNSYNSNGNLTQTWNLVGGSGSGGTYLSKQFSYNSRGVMQTTTDVNGEVMEYTTTSCNNMFSTSQYPSGFTNLGTSHTWDCNGGVVTSSTDANGQTTSTIFGTGSDADPFYRPVESEDPLGNITSLSYSPTTIESSLPVNGGASIVETRTTADSIGRNVVSQLRQSPTGSTWDTKSRTFDGDGRPNQTSLPCATGAGSGCPESTESKTYDALSRPLVHVGTSGDVITKQYIANDVLTTLTPAPSGENVKATQKEFDGLGRLKSVCVISSAAGSGSCGQANGKTGFLTTYSYDAAGHLLQKVENAQVPSPQQTRAYTYDRFGRVLTESNPESATVQNTYDSVSNGNCSSTSQGDLVQKVDANGNSACYHYDGLHRNSSITYSGPNSNGVNKYFVYDSATVNGAVMNYAEGRMAEAYTCSGSCSSKITDEGFSYDQRGQMTTYYQASPNSGGYYALTASYWEDKSLKTLNGVGLPALTYGGLDGEGRVTSVVANGTNLVSGVTYNNGGYSNEPVGALLQVLLGTGDTQSFTYDPNTGRMTQYSAAVGSTTISGTLAWNANATLASNNISDGYNGTDTQYCMYSYDDFIRAASVNCLNGATNIWNQTFTYGSDAFGNLTKSSSGPGLSWMPGYNTVNNHYTLGGTSYDSNGNLLSDTFHTYTWLADGHVATVTTGSTTASVTYDAMGNKVEENIGGVVHEYVSAFGVSAQMTGQTENAVTVNLVGGVQALYSSGSLQRYRFPDWQGTIRAESNPATRTFTESLAFAPFGERYAVQGAPYNVDSFTGQPDQITSDEYDFSARELHNGQGRWVSPDPLSGTGNKYAYADNNPLSEVDLGGLLGIAVNGGSEEAALADELSGIVVDVPAESAPPQDTQTTANTQAPGTDSQQQAPLQQQAQQQSTLPGSPAGLGDGWKDVTPSKRPAGQPRRYKGPKGTEIEFDPGESGQPGWGGKDHWHEVDPATGKRVGKHLAPGVPMPGPDGVVEPEPAPQAPEPSSSPFSNWVHDQWQGFKNYLRDHPYGPNSSPGPYVPPLVPMPFPAIP